MSEQLHMDAVYRHSDEVVARVIEGEVILVPLTAGIGDMESELFTLNPTGKSIWELLDGRATLDDIVRQLAEQYPGSSAEIEQDVQGFVGELLQRRMLVPLSAD